jgi:hypothetical protein
LRIL